jgi:hypothetical protein
VSEIVEDQEAHTDAVAEKFATEVAALATALQEAGVPSTLTAQVVVQVVQFIADAYEMGLVVQFIADAYEMGLKGGADLLEAAVDARIGKLLGGKEIARG